MTQNENIYEICRVYFLVKGHLTDQKTMEDCYYSYFKRLWCNNERAEYSMEKFKLAYNNFINKDIVMKQFKS